MSKIICDICGTTYQDTAECFPICGCSREAAADLLGEELLVEESIEEAVKGGNVHKKKEIFDYDEVNAEQEADEIEDDENPYEEEEDLEEEPKHNTFLVIFLTILIFILLIAAGFVFVRYFLPNMGGEETVPPTTAAQIEEEPTVTTELVIPCEGLWLTSGTAELSQEGQYFLLHVQVTPEDTTDKITYVSADESIATVTEDGRITAVAEGETEIIITCGNSTLSCPVVCHFVEETEPPTEETAAETELVEIVATDLKNVVLKLKKTDIRLGVYYEFQLELDCDLKPEEVKWSSEHPHIATVDDKGVVKAVKDGTTAIIAEYGNQKVQCIVRCSY